MVAHCSLSSGLLCRLYFWNSLYIHFCSIIKGSLLDEELHGVLICSICENRWDDIINKTYYIPTMTVERLTIIYNIWTHSCSYYKLIYQGVLVRVNWRNLIGTILISTILNHSSLTREKLILLLYTCACVYRMLQYM